MDKLSIKVLKYISKRKDVKHEEVVKKFGDKSADSLAFLLHEKYLTTGKVIIGVGPNSAPVFRSDGVYNIKSPGRAYLEQKPGKDFDRWLGRISIIFSILGGALLSKPLWNLIDWLCAVLSDLIKGF